MARKEEMASKKRKTPGNTAKEPKSAVKKAKTPGKKAESAKKVKKSAPKDPLQALLDTHSFLERVSTSYGDKIKCSITEHEMPPKAEVVEKHLGSKKLLQAREKWWSDDWAEKYEPEIVAHKHNDKKLYCTITEQSINKIPGEVEAHVNGKRFKNLKKTKDAKKAKQEALLEKRKARIAKRIAARKAAAAAKNGGKETTDDASAPEEEADVLDDLEDESGDEEDDELAELEDSNDDEDEEVEEEEEGEEEEEEEEEESKPSPPPRRRAAAVASRRRRGNK